MLALATDLAMGQPLEHGLRTAVLAVRLAAAMGLSDDDQATVFYTGLLHFAGCTAESEIDAGFFGDELAARPQMMAAFLGSRRGLIMTAMRVAHSDSTLLERASAMARSAAGGVAEFRQWARTHCDVAQLLGARMGLTAEVQYALGHLYERWDGKGMPGDLRGDQLPFAVRVMHVAQDADMAWQHGGPLLAGQVVSARAGSGLDPFSGGGVRGAGRRGLRWPGPVDCMDRDDGGRARPAADSERGQAGRLPVGGRGFRRPEEHVDSRPFPRRSGDRRARRARRPGCRPRTCRRCTVPRWCTTSAG